MALRKLLAGTGKAFDGLGIRYALIGGYAGILYGSPYSTADIDFVVISEKVDLRLIDSLKKLGWVPTEDYKNAAMLQAFGQFVHKDYGYPLHILPHVDGFSLREKTPLNEVVVEGYAIKVCLPEDLVVMRLAVWSAVDKEKAIAIALSTKLDKKYLKKRASEEKVEKRLAWLMDELKKGE